MSSLKRIIEQLLRDEILRWEKNGWKAKKWCRCYRCAAWREFVRRYEAAGLL